MLYPVNEGQVLKLQLHHSGSHCLLRAASKGVPDGRSRKYQNHSGNQWPFSESLAPIAGSLESSTWHIYSNINKTTQHPINVKTWIKVNTNTPQSQDIIRVTRVTRNIIHILFRANHFFQQVTWHIHFFFAKAPSLSRWLGKVALGLSGASSFGTSTSGMSKTSRDATEKDQRSWVLSVAKFWRLQKEMSFCTMITKSKMLNML